MDSVTHVWRRDKKLFREGIAVNRFVLTQSLRATRKTAAGKPPRRREKNNGALAKFHIKTSIRLSIQTIGGVSAAAARLRLAKSPVFMRFPDVSKAMAQYA